MDIFFQGQYINEEAAESLLSVLHLFKERYQIESFREIRLSMILVDKQGNEVELVDNKTNEAYRCFVVYEHSQHVAAHGHRPNPNLKLVVDNTHDEKKI